MIPFNITLKIGANYVQIKGKYEKRWVVIDHISGIIDEFFQEKDVYGYQTNKNLVFIEEIDADEPILLTEILDLTVEKLNDLLKEENLNYD